MTASDKKVRTRFAPSPTGFLHLGGLRTALFNYLFAKHNGGEFLLRIEDTDRTRLVPEAVESIIDTLFWAGLNYDEGPVFENGALTHKGDHGPYVQSERLPLYKKFADQLVKDGHAYHCFCTAERLEEMRRIQTLKKLPPMYDGTCRNLSPQEVAEKLAAGTPNVIRLKVPHEGETVFTDLVHGEVSFKNELVDDQVLLKSDGFPTYHLAVVVDDHDMQITHVIRGEEWLPSTPKHLMLYAFFGWQPTAYAHLPLLLSPTGGKLSKRMMAVSVHDYINQGYLKEAMINFVTLLGWHPKDDTEVMGIDELIAKFDFDGVSKSGAVFLPEKLDWFNGVYLRKMDLGALADAAKPFLVKAGLIGDDYDREQLKKVVSLEQERAKKLAELPESLAFVFKRTEPKAEIIVWKKQTSDQAKERLLTLLETVKQVPETSWNEAGLEKIIKEMIAGKGTGTGETLWPMRVALSGKEASPGPFAIAAVLGKDETLSRITNAISVL